VTEVFFLGEEGRGWEESLGERRRAEENWRGEEVCYYKK